MKYTWFIAVLLFLLMFFLHGCGEKTLDADTLALAEESDVICLVRVVDAEPGDGYCICKCQVRADYLGNLTRWGMDLNPNNFPPSYLYVRVEGLLDVEDFWPKSKNSLAMTLFLKPDPEERVYAVSRWGEFRVFLPAGRKALRWGGNVDAEGLRLQDALRAYGKTHPGEPVGYGIYGW